MTLGGVRQRLSVIGLVLAAGALLSASAAHFPPQAPVQQAGANEILLAVDPAQSTLHYSVDSTLHTVHGTFTVKTGSVRVDPTSGKAGGEIIVDAASGNSGNDGRDKKMHKDVLESARYTDIVFRPDRVEGKLDPQGRSEVQVHGTLLLHGSEHELIVPAKVEFASGHWTGSTKFSVPYIEWGLKNPSNFMLKVNKAVNIDLELSGNLQAANAQ
jgi:polyisoprenoid-binding protein YceI